VKNLILISLVTILVSCSGGKNSTGYSIINDMVYAVPYEAYSENPIFKDRQTNQLPPKGTIARGFMPHAMDNEGNPIVMENPYNMTDYTWQRGEMLFNANCVACHGVQGHGDGKVVERGFPKPPHFQGQRKFKWNRKDNYTSGTIYNVITFGYGNMPSHAQQLYPEDRWYVSEYVRERLMIDGKE
jgi:cytochrome c5